MDKATVKQIVNDEIKKFISDSLDKEMKKILRSNSSDSRDELVTTIKNSFEEVFKNMWQKRDYWRSSIK